MPLAEWVQHRQRARIRRTCWNYFKHPYQSGHDRERFAAFLSTLTMGLTAYARELALFFNQFLEPPEIPVEPDPPGRALGHGVLPGPQLWLRSFFQDEPEWERRLRAWIARAVVGSVRLGDE
jgi:hypothetical protein